MCSAPLFEIGLDQIELRPVGVAVTIWEARVVHEVDAAAAVVSHGFRPAPLSSGCAVAKRSCISASLSQG